MRQIRIGDVTIDSIIERDGSWRLPEKVFRAYDPELGRRHFAEMDKCAFAPRSGKIVITYQTLLKIRSTTNE
jgi:hypothetical protein